MKLRLLCLALGSIDQVGFRLNFSWEFLLDVVRSDCAICLLLRLEPFFLSFSFATIEFRECFRSSYTQSMRVLLAAFHGLRDHEVVGNGSVGVKQHR